MQAQRKYRLHWKQWLWGIPLGLLAIWQWTLFSNMIRQLFLGFLVMLAALPLMNFLEKRVSTGWAATLAMAGLSVGAGLFLLLLIPPLEPLFDVAELSAGLVGAIVGLAFASMVVIQILKAIRTMGKK